MKSTTVRCMFNGCRVKTDVVLPESLRDEYQEAIRAGIERHVWERYWEVLRKIDARCWQHEWAVKA